MKINLTQWLCKTGKCACLHLQNKIFHILSLSSGSLSNIACAGVLLEVSGNLKIPQLWDRSGHKWELRTLLLSAMTSLGCDSRYLTHSVCVLLNRLAILIPQRTSHMGILSVQEPIFTLVSKQDKATLTEWFKRPEFLLMFLTKAIWPLDKIKIPKTGKFYHPPHFAPASLCKSAYRTETMYTGYFKLFSMKGFL